MKLACKIREVTDIRADTRRTAWMIFAALSASFLVMPVSAASNGATAGVSIPCFINPAASGNLMPVSTDFALKPAELSETFLTANRQGGIREGYSKRLLLKNLYGGVCRRGLLKSIARSYEDPPESVYTQDKKSKLIDVLLEKDGKK